MSKSEREPAVLLTEEQRIQENREFIAKLNVMDDIFFQKIVADPLVCQEILRIILEEPELEIRECRVQDSLKNLQGRSVVLDVNCQDSKGVYYNIEVQKQDNDDHQRRTRYNRALLTSNVTRVGVDFIDVPDVKTIYISKFDMFKEGQTIYRIERRLSRNGKAVENGTAEIYVNSKVDDGTEIAELMQYFQKSVGYHNKFPCLSNRVKMFKESEEGVMYMSSVIEEIRAKSRDEGKLEGKMESVKALLLRNIASTEEDACVILGLDYNEYSLWKRNLTLSK